MRTLEQFQAFQVWVGSRRAARWWPQRGDSALAAANLFAGSGIVLLSSTQCVVPKCVAFRAETQGGKLLARFGGWMLFVQPDRHAAKLGATGRCASLWNSIVKQGHREEGVVVSLKAIQIPRAFLV
ncbi:hypothetical protein D0T25_12180 [Duganella sp. BJB488]|nr:hypothetical protein D0T26_14925 [Duganella sp. BJB489]RFP22027.1 hypothetical protein D0T25_12180 [Duganella sp. BJB488]